MTTEPTETRGWAPGDRISLSTLASGWGLSTLATRPDSAIPNEGAQDENGGTSAVQIDYQTRVVTFEGNKGTDDARLREAAHPGYGDDTYDIFAVFPLGDDKWRLFMRREKR